MIFPDALCLILLVIVFVLLLKLCLLKKDLTKLGQELTERLGAETNSLLTTNSRDYHLRQLVVVLNKQLRLLRKQQQRYFNGNRELTESITNISHDLRTPLTAICGYLELLEQVEKAPVVEGYLEIITNRVTLLKKLTEELFRYSVASSPRNDSIQESISLNEVIAESVAEFYGLLKDRQIEPQIKLPQKSINRTLNHSALSRVLSNLLSNVINYSDGDLLIVLAESGEMTFTNTALKLNEIAVGKLFDRYYTVDSAKKSTGLGLAITRVLIEEMGGSVSASYYNQQLCISIQLPVE